MQAEIDAMPNEYCVQAYKIAAFFAEKYGANESGAGGEGGNGSPPAIDYNAKKAELRQQIDGLSKNPFHKAEDKQKLINELQRITVLSNQKK